MLRTKVFPGEQDPGQASPGMQGNHPSPPEDKAKWEAAMCCPHHLSRLGRPGWMWLSTKTTWHLGQEAGIPLMWGVLEMVTVHGSNAGKDRPHPSP